MKTVLNVVRFENEDVIATSGECLVDQITFSKNNKNEVLVEDLVQGFYTLNNVTYSVCKDSHLHATKIKDKEPNKGKLEQDKPVNSNDFNFAVIYHVDNNSNNIYVCDKTHPE